MDFNLGSQEVRRGWGPGFVAVALAVPGSGVQVSGGATLEALGLWSKNKDHASLMVAFLLYGLFGHFYGFLLFSLWAFTVCSVVFGSSCDVFAMHNRPLHFD